MGQPKRWAVFCINVHVEYINACIMTGGHSRADAQVSK